MSERNRKLTPSRRQRLGRVLHGGLQLATRGSIWSRLCRWFLRFAVARVSFWSRVLTKIKAVLHV